jgi:hypothetical protein
MRIKSEPSPDNELGFVVINVEDFDPDIMQDFDEKELPAAVVPAAVVPAAGAVTPPWSK